MKEEFNYDDFNWSEYFKVDESSASGLIWNRYIMKGKNGCAVLKRPGDIAGSLCNTKNGSNKAWRTEITFNGTSKSFAVHRIIAVLSGMKVNGLVVDHINGVSKDNTVSNLRVVTQDVNTRNCKPNYNSPYGIPGINFVRSKEGREYFTSSVFVNGKGHTKCFRIDQLGVTESFRRAIVHRLESIEDLNQAGYGYTNRHTVASN